VEALRRLHLKHFVHRDIRPSNILVHNRRALLIDFWLAIHRVLADPVGDLIYASGMVLESARDGKKYLPSPTDDLESLAKVGFCFASHIGMTVPLLREPLMSFARATSIRKPPRATSALLLPFVMFWLMPTFSVWALSHQYVFPQIEKPPHENALFLQHRPQQMELSPFVSEWEKNFL